MERKIILLRLSENEKVVYGIMIVMEGNVIKFVCRTIENKAKLFPPGTYPLKFESSPAFKMDLWELYNVVGHPDDPNRPRAEIKIHIANKYSQLKGCIGIGLNHQHIDDDGLLDVTDSGEALKQFHKAMGTAHKTSSITVIKNY